MKRLLAIDGGGIRGIIPATVIAELEQRAGKPVRELFDMIAGNSTGGIIATGLLAGIEASRLVSLYVDHGSEIFANEDRLHGALRPRYSAAPLENILHTMLGDVWLGDTAGPELLVPAQCLSPTVTAWFFKSWKARGTKLNVGDDKNALDFPLWEIARATSAAPTYFPSAKITNRAGKTFFMTDGGTFCNNPSVAAWASAQILWPGEPCSILSIGTGDAASRPLNGEASQGWGAVEWITEGNLVSLCMTGTAEATSYILSCLGDHVRIEAFLPPEATAMDDASSINIARLRAIAQELVSQQRSFIDRFV